MNQALISALRPAASSRRRILPRVAVFLQLVVQRLQAYTQNLRRTRLILSCRLKRSQNQHPLGLIHRRPHAYRHHVGIGYPRRHRQLWSTEGSRQMRSVQRNPIRAQNHGAFNRIAQFARISRPVIRQHPIKNLIRQPETCRVCF